MSSSGAAGGANIVTAGMASNVGQAASGASSSPRASPPEVHQANGVVAPVPTGPPKPTGGRPASGSVPPAQVVQEEEAVSYVNQEGDWKYRKINLLRVMRGFVNQLRPGQDLTKISLPAECCYPYGLLEVMGSRELSMAHLLFAMNRYPNDPLERFLAAVRFFLGTVRSERFDKKPWNPVLGETHITYADVLYGDDGIGMTETAQATSAASSSSKAPAGAKSRTIFVGEQVSHHPPVSAFSLSNSKEEIECSANVSFSVRFGGNQVIIATAGTLQIFAKKFKETYELTKCVPDMVVRNVVWGKKYIMWEGEVSMTCPETGYTVFFKFEEKRSQNVVTGYIIQGDSDDPLFEIHGVAGEKVTYNRPDSPKNEKVLLDLTTEPLARIHYLPKSKLAPLSSVGVWEPVNKAVVDDDMVLADKEKKVIEQAQRERSAARMAANQEYTGCYFDMGPEGLWQYKGNMDLDRVLAEGAESIDPAPLIDSDDEFVSQDEDPEPLLPASSSNGRPKSLFVVSSAPPQGDGKVPSITSDAFSDGDRSPITSGDELEIEGDSAPVAASHLDPTRKARRGSTSSLTPTKNGLSASTSSIAPSSSKKELRAEKKKAREEVKMVMRQAKEDKKKGGPAPFLDQQIHAGNLKVRNLMKQWKDRYIVLLPGQLAIFRSASDVSRGNCVGLLMLSGCDVRPRPSKKDGACFKIYSLRQYPIYSKQGLKGETISSAMLPVGADYCILRCSDQSSLATWIEKIHQCIPDWEKNKALIRAAGLDADSDTDDDSDDSELEPVAVTDSALSPSVSSVSLAAAAASPSLSSIQPTPALSSHASGHSITNEEVLNQIGQLYKITKRLSQKHKKASESVDELRTKTIPDGFADIKRALNASATAKKNPFDKPHKPSGMVNKIKGMLDAKTILLLAIIVVLLYFVLFPSVPPVEVPSSSIDTSSVASSSTQASAASVVDTVEKVVSKAAKAAVKASPSK